MSIRNQSTRSLKLRLGTLLRETQEVEKELVERAERQEETEEQMAAWRHLVTTGEQLLKHLQLGDVVTSEWATQRDRWFATLQQILSSQNKGASDQ
jgi:hypothetical protein